VEAYCVRCKVKREIAQGEAVFTATGTPATKGACPICGTRLFRMGRTPAHEGLIPPVVEKAERASKRGGKRRGKLVIVESPAKARTIGRYLGKGYVVRASVGHVRDLLRSQLSVDVENGFEPKYRVPNEKKDVVKGLAAEAAKAEEVYLATDPDREGEAIAWHLMEAARIDPARARRVSFHEITPDAVREAFEHPRAIDQDLVDAQQGRRVLDRLVGYNLSPLLWSKVRSRLSAGRVQSVALRMVVDREREVERFVAAEYWTIDAALESKTHPPVFRARLARVDERAPELPSREAVDAVLGGMRSADYTVVAVKRGARSRRPSPPFTTSTLQQDASRRLGFTARKTMAVAQQLYEGVDLDQHEPVGLITYMRTDSPQVSLQAQQEARRVIAMRFGPEYVPDEPPVYRARTRGAQEAHEAIRPTAVSREPQSVASYLTPDQLKLYTLVWKRFVASQMKPAEYDTQTIEVEGKASEHVYGLRAAASSVRFGGFLEVYEDRGNGGNGSNGENGEEAGESEPIGALPEVEPGEKLDLVDLFPDQHFTQPPPRYTEATLVKAMEELGIGRPSTYAPTLSTLQARHYVRREAKALIPTETGMVVTDLLVDHFPEIVDLGFTARMEEELDEVADGELGWVDVVRGFYIPFAEQVEDARRDMPEVKAEPEVLDRPCPACGKPLLLRMGRFGKFIGCSDFPACRYTEPWLERLGVPCPQDGGELVIRRTRKGRVFYGCANYPNCDFTSWKKPLSTPCPRCGGLLVLDNRDHAVCLACQERTRMAELPAVEPDMA
jgi:DNA topoisomerase-1